MQITGSSVAMGAKTNYVRYETENYTASRTNAVISGDIGNRTTDRAEISDDARQIFEARRAALQELLDKPKGDKGEEKVEERERDKSKEEKVLPPQANAQAAIASGKRQQINSEEDFKIRLLELLLRAINRSKGKCAFGKLDTKKLEQTISEMKKSFSSSYHYGVYNGTSAAEWEGAYSSSEIKQQEQVQFTGLSGGVLDTGSGRSPGRNVTIRYAEEGVSFTQEIYESEKMEFNASIQVETADGQRMNVDLSLNVSREFYQKIDTSYFASSMQRLIDPLVINFGTASARLSDQKFAFDIDCDGSEDQISMLQQGSGFLALDQNGDGVVNDGSELFGALSGDGFADLAAHDLDHNGWIDANDDIFDKLRIWTQDEKGEDKLIALGEKGIGAIYLGSVETDYSLKSDQNNNLNGMLRKTGFFLRENFTAGTVQHMDLVV